jgi:hypothetical protein
MRKEKRKKRKMRERKRRKKRRRKKKHRKKRDVVSGCRPTAMSGCSMGVDPRPAWVWSATKAHSSDDFIF